MKKSIHLKIAPIVILAAVGFAGCNRDVTPKPAESQSLGTGPSTTSSLEDSRTTTTQTNGTTGTMSATGPEGTATNPSDRQPASVGSDVDCPAGSIGDECRRARAGTPNDLDSGTSESDGTQTNPVSPR